MLGFLRDRSDRFIERQVWMFLSRPCVDLVVDIGDVAHIDDMIRAIAMAQQAKEQVEHDHRPSIADMGEVVDGRPAHVEAHARRIQRHKHPLFPRQRIVKPQVHRIAALSVAVSFADWARSSDEKRKSTMRLSALLTGRRSISKGEKTAAASVGR